MDFGFLIVEKYERLYEKYKNRYSSSRDWYAIPRIDKSPECSKIKYRGIDRDCLVPYKDSERNLAEIYLSEVNKNKDIDEEDFVSKEDIDKVYAFLEESKKDFETIFVRKYDCGCQIPPDFKSIGFEPSYFTSDHFSASCDCMLIPRWHGTDKEGLLFMEHFNKLNEYGLFPTALEAKEFLDYYLSFDWTERGDYFITEVFIET